MKKVLLFFVLLFASALTLSAQNWQVSGKVTYADDGSPVIGATILVKGTSTATMSDVNGMYKLTIPASAEKILVASFAGLTTQEQIVSSAGQTVDFVMETDAQQIDNVIVTAFGVSTKRSFTGSAAVVGGDQIAKSQVSNVTNALAGAVAGVQLTSSNGAPGSSSTIRIRGFSSISAGMAPLIIVDGAPYSGDISNINPADVESMTVLKDAASNALYGARGANGVIMITTKKAKAGDAVVSVDAKYGVNTRGISNYNVINNPALYYETHAAAVNAFYLGQGRSAAEANALVNANLFGPAGSGGLGYNVYTTPAGQKFIGMNGKVNPNATLGRMVNYGGEDYWVTPDDWTEAGYRNGARQEYNINISGGSDRVTYFSSLSYLSNEGITAGSGMSRLTARLRSDYQAKSWLKVGANVSYTKFNSDQLANNGSSNSTGNVWAFTSQMAPIYPLYVRTGDGKVKLDDNGFEMMDYGNGMNAGMNRALLSNANSLMDNRLNTRNSEGNAMSGSTYLDVTFMEGLKLTVNATIGLDETRGTTVLNPYYGQFASTKGTVGKSHVRSFDVNYQQLLNYTKTFADKHNISAMLGHEYFDTKYYYLYASKSNMFSQDNKELSGAVVDGQSASSYQTQYNNEGYFFRLGYDYDNKLFFSGSFRRDASSRFAPEARWGNFWSLGAAWLMNRESWMQFDWLNELKVKASIGSQGNDNIGNYRYTDTYTIANSDGNVSVMFDSKGSKNITWETNTNFNAGVEFGFLNRISGSLEYFNRKTTNMLFSFSVAPSMGYSSYYANVGDMSNYGAELALNFNIFNSKDIRWDVNANLTWLKNRITMLDEAKKTKTAYDTKGNAYYGYQSGSAFVAEGVSLYTWYLKDYAGVDAETGESLWYKDVKGEGGVRTGERETTKVYADADFYIIDGSSPIPDLYGGFGTTLYLYGFDFSINFTYQVGGKGYDSGYASFMASPAGSSAGYNFHADVLNSWSPENTTSNIPRFQYGDTYSAASSSRFLVNASYLNLQNINVGYTLPQKWTTSFGVNSIRFYVAAENLWYSSARQGYDPRQAYGASGSSYYSPMKTISGGINIKF